MEDELDSLIFGLLEDYELVMSCDRIIDSIPEYLQETYLEELRELIDTTVVKEDQLRVKLEEYSRYCEKNNVPKELNYIRNK